MLGLYHLYLGKVDPVKLSSQWNFSQRPARRRGGPASASGSALAAGEIRETFDRARPQHVWYQRGRERLKEYRAIAAAGGWPTVRGRPDDEARHERPARAGAAPAAAVTKDLERRRRDAPDAAVDPTVYDATLEAAVKASRSATASRRMARSGPGTRAALNVPVAARIDQIRVNLERARWTLHEIKGEFVLVDVAGFYVSYFRNDEPIWTSQVVVGRDRPRDADLPLDDHLRRVQPDVDHPAGHPGQGQAAGD